MHTGQNMRNRLIAVAGSCSLATGWYAVSPVIFDGFAGTIVPVAGAIAIASVLPAIFSKKMTKHSEYQECFTMSQRLEALNKHASINIVNEKNDLTEVNERLLEMTGYAREELIGQKVSILYEDSVLSVADEVRSYLVEGRTWQGETQLRRKDGSILYTQSTIMPLFDEKGEWAGSISARTDVTQANQLLAERDTAQTLNELRDDIWIVDSETEQFIYMNGAAEMRFSVQANEYRTKKLIDFNHNNQIEDVLLACRSLRRNGEASMQFESSLLGVPMHVSIKFLPGPEDGGRYLILFNDISDRLIQEQRKSAFISNVSHELRSPLTSIKGAMGLLLSRSVGDLPDKAMDLLEIAHRNADRLILIINDILDLDKISNGQMDFDIREVDVLELVKEAEQSNALMQQRFSVKTIVEGPNEALMAHTDPNRIIQVLTNLLGNAFKFSKPGSEIVLRVENAQDQIRISVKDQGPGIPANEEHKIFDRFADMTNSDRATKGGTGLGLSISRAIVESLGGKIGFDTEVGAGTTFYFDLPKDLVDPLVGQGTTVQKIA